MNDVSSPPKPKKRGRMFLLFLIVLVIGLALLNYHLWQSLFEIKEHVNQQTAPLKEQITGLHQQLKNLPQQDSQTQPFIGSLKHLEKQVTTLTQQQQQLQMAVRTLAQKPRYRADWLLAEIAYLLNLANQRLVLVADVEGALTALTLAQARLQQTNNPSVLTVRKQLTADIERLRQIPRPDISGFAIKLSSFIVQVENLPLLQSQHQQIKPTTEPETQTVEKSLGETLWHAVRQLVVIRYNAEASTGLLTAEQSHFITQNLRLQLESARLALLRQDSKNLAVTVETAQQWLKRYYDQKDKMVEKLQILLNQLQQLEFSQKLPDISLTLHSLQQLITPPVPLQEESEETTDDIKP